MIPVSASIPVIDESALRSVMTPARAVDAMREAFKADGEGRTRVVLVIIAEEVQQAVKCQHAQFRP